MQGKRNYDSFFPKQSIITKNITQIHFLNYLTISDLYIAKT